MSLRKHPRIRPAGLWSLQLAPTLKVALVTGGVIRREIELSTTHDSDNTYYDSNIAQTVSVKMEDQVYESLSQSAYTGRRLDHVYRKSQYRSYAVLTLSLVLSVVFVTLHYADVTQPTKFRREPATFNGDHWLFTESKVPKSKCISNT
jgi:hypothetical protein